MALLVRLAEEGGHPVPREELIDSVWDGAFVSDDAVNSAVARLRRALDRASDDGSPSAIETIPGVGYRLRLPVHVEPADPVLTPEPRGPVSGSGSPAPVATAPSPPSRADRPSEANAGRPTAGRRRAIVAGTAVALAASVGATLVAVTIARPDRDDPPIATSAAPPAPPPWVRPLTALPGLEVQPALVPGEHADRVAFAWRPSESDDWNLYVQAVGGGPPLQLTSDPGADLSPTWTPDASRLAFVRRRDGECGIWIVPALGGEEQRLADCVGPSDLAFADGGRRLLYCDRDPIDAADRGLGLGPYSPRRLYELELATGVVRTLTEPPVGGMGDHAVAVADDGTVAFVRSPVLGVEDVYLLGAGGEVRRLTFDNLKIHGLDWLPDQRGLLISSNRGGLFGLWQVPLDGGEPTPWLSATGGQVDAPSVGARGRRVAFEQWDYETNLYRLDLEDPETPRLLMHSTRWDYQPAISPDGFRLAFVSDRTGSSELWTADADGSDAEPQTSFGGPYVTSPSWSPDGRRIAFDLRSSGHGDLWLLEPPDARPRRLTDSPAQELAPSWSPDGESLFFASNRGGTWEVWRLDLAGGDPVQVTEGGGYRALATSGGDLLFTRADEAGLWRLSPGGGAPERLLDDLAPVDRLNWVLAGETIYYVTRPNPDSPHLARLGLATGERELLGPLQRFPFGSGLAATPSGGAVLFARHDRRESDLMLFELTDGDSTSASPPDRGSPSWR
jgi:Tol biopolymer transport system component/DNA-binding winged helix-turn-helix (wHTH) protein